MIGAPNNSPSRYRRLFLIIRTASYFFILTHPGPGWTKGNAYSFRQIQVKDEKLTFHFSSAAMFNKEVFQGLQKGMTAAVEYQIQLWKQQKNWVDQLVTETICRMKIGFDPWERRYILTRHTGEVSLLDEDGVWEQCARLSAFPLLDAGKLEPERRYRIVIHITFQPMSMENVEDIRRWLSGEAEEINPKAIRASKSPLKKTGDWFLNLVVNLSGFGDRVLLAKGPPFAWQGGSVVLLEEE